MARTFAHGLTRPSRGARFTCALDSKFRHEAPSRSALASSRHFASHAETLRRARRCRFTVTCAISRQLTHKLLVAPPFVFPVGGGRWRMVQQDGRNRELGCYFGDPQRHERRGRHAKRAERFEVPRAGAVFWSTRSRRRRPCTCASTRVSFACVCARGVSESARVKCGLLRRGARWEGGGPRARAGAHDPPTPPAAHHEGPSRAPVGYGWDTADGTGRGGVGRGGAE